MVAATKGPGWRWFTELDRARARAEADGEGLFIFVHDATDEESARMMQLLQSSEAADLLARSVNCSLADSDDTREQLRAYAVETAPTFIAVRPDGTFRKGSGAITLEELRDFTRFLGTQP